jgi:hypothetical protein
VGLVVVGVVAAGVLRSTCCWTLAAVHLRKTKVPLSKRKEVSARGRVPGEEPHVRGPGLSGFQMTRRPREASLREGAQQAPRDAAQDPFASQLCRDESKERETRHRATSTPPPTFARVWGLAEPLAHRRPLGGGRPTPWRPS